jgi:hypothetical protein
MAIARLRSVMSLTKASTTFFSGALHHASFDLQCHMAAVFSYKLHLVGACGFARAICPHHLYGLAQAACRQDIRLQEIFTYKLFTLVTYHLFASAVTIQKVAFQVVDVNTVRGLFQVPPEQLLALAQRFLRPLALGDVTPDTVVYGTIMHFRELRRHVDIPDLTLLGALASFKIAQSFGYHLGNVRLGFFRSLNGFDIAYLQPGEFLARIPQLLVGHFVEFQKPPRLRVNDDNAVGRLFEQQVVASFGVAQRFLRSLALGDVVSKINYASVGLF